MIANCYVESFILNRMTLKQLSILREIARQRLVMSSAAAVLYTLQPGISRQIHLLEEELGVVLLRRRRNRVLGFTDVGKSVLGSAQRLLFEAENIKLMAQDAREEQVGKLSVVTTHLHARYTLAQPIAEFAQRHPGIQLHLLQTDAGSIAKLVESGEADIAVSTERERGSSSLLVLPGPPLRRSLIVPRAHPLAHARRVTLKDIARYPLVGYNPASRSGELMADALRAHGIDAQFVLSASDADVIKTYVLQGLGIAIVPSIALEAETAKGLRVIDVTHLFPKSVIAVSLRPGVYVRAFVREFIEMVVPGVKVPVLE